MSNTSSQSSQSQPAAPANLLLFEAVFKHKDIGEAFHTFLKNDRSDEGWSYICALQKAEAAIKDKKAFENKVDEIIKNYLEMNAPKSVNISSDTRKTVLQNLAFEKTLKPLKLVKKFIVTEMKHDSFKRFLRSKDCVVIMKKYSHNTDVIVPAITEKFSYNNKDFSKPEITNHDLQFMEHLLKDSPDWELLSSFLDGEYGKRVGNIWYSHTNYFPNVTIVDGISLSKCEMMLPFSFLHVLCSFYPLSQQLKMDPFLTHHDLIKMIPGDKNKSTGVLCKNCNFGFPLNPRLLPEACAAFYDPCLRTFTIIGKPCDIEALAEHSWMEEKSANVVSKKGDKPKTTKSLRMFEYHCTRIQQLGSYTTLLQQVSLFSLGGWAKKTSTLKTMARDRGNNLLVGLVTNLKATPNTVQITDLKRRKSYPIDAYAQLVTEYESEILETDDMEMIGGDTMSGDLLSFGDGGDASSN